MHLDEFYREAMFSLIVFALFSSLWAYINGFTGSPETHAQKYRIRQIKMRHFLNELVSQCERLRVTLL